MWRTESHPARTCMFAFLLPIPPLSPELHSANWWKRTTLVPPWGTLGMRFLRSQLWCIAKLIFMHGVRSLYTFLYWVSIFSLRTFYLGIKCHLAPFTVLFTNYFIFGGKWFHLVTIMRDKIAWVSGLPKGLGEKRLILRLGTRKPQAREVGGGGVLWIQVTGMIEWGIPTKHPQKNRGSKINRKTIPGRISEPYMLKFPEGDD